MKINIYKKILISATTILINISTAIGCTNFLLTASTTGGNGNLISYAADSHSLYGCLYHFKAQDYPENSTLDIYDWDSGEYLGKIPQVSHTFNVVGNINEHQVTIAETTYGGLEPLQKQDGAIIDYGSLIYITLQRAKTAREAIMIIDQLTSTYGYASEGESFSIADKNEVWIMEMIGKGNFGKGMVWVAKRVPDGYVCAHANQARITTFDYQKKNRWDDKNADTFNSSDVISFAKQNNFYKGNDSDFSFSDVYNPVNFEGARFCEIRVWAFFADVAPKTFAQNPEYWNYAKGNVKRKQPLTNGALTKDNFATNRLPLWIKPDQNISLHQTINSMRNHLENTELDMSKDCGAGPFGCPYRMRPLTFESNGKTYLNERATATQQTGFVFVSQMRSHLPDYVGGVIWFAPDDAASAVLAPFYCSITEIPEEYSQNNGSLVEWSDNSAFWINNLISNWAYTRYNLISPEITKNQQQTEENYIKQSTETEKEAIKLARQDIKNATDYLTKYCCNTASQLVKDRKQFFTFLFMKFMDGNVKADDGNQHLKQTDAKAGIPIISQPGYGQKWQDDVAKQTGDKLLYYEN